MIHLRDKNSGLELGLISEEDLQFLVDNLEEETEEDKDYYINRSTIEAFKEKKANQSLIDLLEAALGNRDDMEIEWSQTE